MNKTGDEGSLNPPQDFFIYSRTAKRNTNFSGARAHTNTYTAEVKGQTRGIDNGVPSLFSCYFFFSILLNIFIYKMIS